MQSSISNTGRCLGAYLLMCGSVSSTYRAGKGSLLSSVLSQETQWKSQNHDKSKTPQQGCYLQEVQIGDYKVGGIVNSRGTVTVRIVLKDAYYHIPIH